MRKQRIHDNTTKEMKQAITTLLYPSASDLRFPSIARLSVAFLLALVSLGASAQLESVKELSMKSEYFSHERQVLIYT